MADESIPRRKFLWGAGLAGTAVASLARTAVATGLTQPAAADAPAPPAAETNAAAQPEPLLTLTADRDAFFSAAADTFIPADRLSPSGTDCGLVTYMDRQLAGAWGNGARLYRGGPFHQGKPEHGYQLPLTPREFFAAGIRAANAWSRKTYGKDFDRLAGRPRRRAQGDGAGKAEFPDFNEPFFEALSRSAWKASSPTRSMAATATRRRGGWSAIPACRRAMARRQNYRGKKFNNEPQSIADFS